MCGGSAVSALRSPLSARRSPLDQALDQVTDDRSLLFDELLDALIGEVEQRLELVAAERHAFRRALDLDELTRSGLDDVHVDLGAAVVVVGEIEERLAVDDADADRGDEIDQRDRGDGAALLHLLERER